MRQHYRIGITAIVVLLGASHALGGAGSIASFRPPKISVVHLSERQRLELSLSSLRQAAIFGKKGGDPAVVNGRKVDSPKSRRTVSEGELAARIGDKYVLGVIFDSAVVTGELAIVPTRFYLSSSHDPSEAVITELRDSIVLQRGKYDDWGLSSAKQENKVLRILLDRDVAKGMRASSPSYIGDFNFLDSDSLLLPKSLHATLNVLTSSSSNAVFGKDVVSVPWGVYASSRWSGNFEHHDYVVATDISWGRLLACDDYEDMMCVAGSHGSGVGQLGMPMGIRGGGHACVVADALNNRVSLYELPFQGQNQTDPPVWVRDYCGDYSHPTDAVGKSGTSNAWLVVADAGNDRVQVIAHSGRGTVCAVDTILEEVTSTDSLAEPTSVCFGRDQDGRQNDFLYVVDRGNSRVIMFRDFGASGWTAYYIQTVVGADLISVDVDNFGHVFVVDALGAVVYKFTSDLSPLAKFQLDRPAGQSLYPKTIAVAHGDSSDFSSPEDIPLQLGDVLLTQSYTAESGIYRYVLGVDVLYAGTTFYPRNPTSPSQDFLAFQYYLTDIANLTVEMRQGPNTYVAHPRALEVAGLHSDLWALPALPSAPTGTYEVSIIAESVYPGSNSFESSFNIYVDRSAYNNHPVIQSPPVPICDPACVCMLDQTVRLFQVSASDADGDPLSYQWNAIESGRFENGRDTVTTTTNYVSCFMVEGGIGTAGETGNPVPLPSMKVTARDNRGGSSFTSQSATFSFCPNQCNCNCHADPVCDGAIDILDVVRVVEVSFRNEVSTFDADCPHNVGYGAGRTDVDCSGATEILDVVHIVNVAFRAAHPWEHFCNPCHEE